MQAGASGVCECAVVVALENLWSRLSGASDNMLNKSYIKSKIILKFKLWTENKTYTK